MTPNDTEIRDNVSSHCQQFSRIVKVKTRTNFFVIAEKLGVYMGDFLILLVSCGVHNSLLCVVIRQHFIDSKKMLHKLK